MSSPTAKYLKLKVHWNKAAGKPFVYTGLPIITDPLLKDVIRDQVVRRDRSKAKEIDFVRDIKSAQSLEGMDATNVLECPISMYFTMIKDENPKELHVVIDKPIPTSSVAKKNPYNVLMSNARPKYTDFTSKWTTDQVEEFLDGYHGASNKATYLASFETMADKPNINQQLEAYIVQYLNDNNIQFKAGTGGEEDTAKAGLAKLVKVVLFVNEYRSKLGKDQKMKYRGSEILTSVKRCTRAKACQAKLEDLSRKKVLEEFKKACAAAESFPVVLV